MDDDANDTNERISKGVTRVAGSVYFAYTILSDRPSLVADLRTEGYNLDLTEYAAP
jgi:hypothetical protein